MTKLARASLIPLLLAAAPLSAEVVSGTGTVPVGKSKDVETIRVRAEREARRAVVVQMLEATIGAPRVAEVPQATIDDLAAQIRPEMITDRESGREGNDFFVRFTADIDGAWFRGLLSNKGIDSSSQRAMNDNYLIFVMLDQNTGTARDDSRPVEETVDYQRDSGAAISAQSAQVSQSKSASGVSVRSAGGYGAAEDGPGYSGREAGGYANSASAAARTSQASASKSDVRASEYDRVRYRRHTIWQRPPQGSAADTGMAALRGSLSDYGVAFADSWAALSGYFDGQPPRYDMLKRDARYQGFLDSLQSRNAPFFMGGTMNITHAGRDPATGEAVCTGTLDASASATADGRDIGSDTVNAEARATTPELCEGVVAKRLALAAATSIGPRIQNYWRRIANVEAARGQNTQQLNDYALTLRSDRLDMAMQADILDALQATQGVESQNFVSQAGNEMRFTVRYAGSVPLQLALYQKLRGRPGFANMQSTANGRSVLLCLSGCGSAR
ncbi:hypothetical protein [Sphingomonas sanxanigenens]|uniref:Uncharacterized protein n=1 Tax=Sphingomonas sanxanigenens DSM 19645 = NX02 TaxID=1123269 RepID=W0A5R3_9SPHN|nr:hypothetical protein [Sphingomonas sanxanigenens]AHE52396.1 hypothetical protein NX02_03210 [Sphingomonas sanxanigenens DSM 19645 = NX02]